MKTAASGVVMSDKSGRLFSKEESSSSDEMSSETIFSCHDAGKSGCSSSEQQIPKTSSNPGIEPEEQNMKEGNQEVFEPVFKCK